MSTRFIYSAISEISPTRTIRPGGPALFAVVSTPFAFATLDQGRPGRPLAQLEISEDARRKGMDMEAEKEEKTCRTP